MADVNVESIGLLRWGKLQPSAEQALARSLPPSVAVEWRGEQIIAYAANRELLSQTRTAIAAALAQVDMTARYRLGGRDADGTYSDRPVAAPAVLILTMNDVPGYSVEALLGEAYGMTVMSRNVFSQWGADLKSKFGGELGGMTKLIEKSRDEARARLTRDALRKKANAVIAYRVDISEMGGDWTLICAYGTAVRISKQTAAASLRETATVSATPG